ncbi:MAG: glycosyltransferase family 39 protein [Leptolyngbyaceae cyanobacterium CSU_1_4]|nr:glycosyltransferase family 39 protein [Leptolyngbyaceae cyanobacterium CSU_1_4]
MTDQPLGKMKPADPSASTDRLIILALTAVAIALFTINLGGVPLRDWDEGLVAQVAREIWQAPAGSLTWLYPTIWGEPYLNKPPLVHGLVAIAYSLGGVNEWTARLPGALLTAASVPLLYAIGRELFYQRLPAVLAALVYLTSLPVLRNGRLAMLDGAVLCFVMVMMLCAVRSRRDYRYAWGMGLGLGLIALTKGMMMAMIMGAIALLFLLWDTPRLLTFPYFWFGIVLGSLPASLWYGAQGFHYGQLLGNNLFNQSFQRIWTDVENNRGAPWYYLLEMLKYGVPWILFLPLGGRLAWANRNLSWAKLAIAWTGVYFVAISLMATKLPWYILPLYPALALLIGAQLAALWRRGQQVGIPQFATKPYSPVWVGWFAGLALAAIVGVVYFSGQQFSEFDLQLVLAAFALTMLVTAALMARQNPQFIAVLLWGTYLSLLLFMASNNWVWELAEHYPVKPVAAMIQRFVPNGELVYTSFPDARPSLSFYSDRPVIPTSQQS